MALIQRRNGDVLNSNITLVRTNELQLKIERVDKRVDLQFVSSNQSLLDIKEVLHNTRNDSWYFTLVAQEPGLASVRIQSTAPAQLNWILNPSTINVKIVSQITLPDENSLVGLMVRLFLMEVADPESRGGDGTTDADAKIAMQYMRLVIENRLNNKPQQFNAKNAQSITDIVRAPGQFAGFEGYPRLENNLNKRISAIEKMLNDGVNPLRDQYVSFYQAALDVANSALIPDPCPTGLYAWRTRGSSSPGPRFKKFQTVAGNDFYTLTGN